MEDYSNLFKQIPGFPCYSINPLGTIKGKRKILKQRTGSTGYKEVTIRNTEGILKRQKVHRLVLITFVGPPKDGQVAMHLDNNRTNNCLDNLRWGTQKENLQSLRKPIPCPVCGTIFYYTTEKPACSRSCRLTLSNKFKKTFSDGEARRILYMVYNGIWTQADVARAYGVSTGLVCDLVNRRCRKHLWEPYLSI